MKKASLFVAAILPLLLFAQEISINWSPEFKRKNNYVQYYSIGGDTQHYFVLYRESNKDILQTYDHQHNLVGQRELKFSVGKDRLSLSDVIQASDYYYLYLIHDINRGKLREIYLQRMDQKGELYGDIKLISTVSYKKTGLDIWRDRLDLNYDTDENGLIMSPDKRLFLSVSLARNTESKEEEKTSLTIFDQELNVKWTRVQEFPYADKQIVLDDISLSNEGAVLITARLYESARERDLASDTFKYKFFIITEKGTKEVNIEPGEGKFATNAVIFPGEANGYFVGGLYALTSGGTLIRDCGYYGIRVDKETGKQISMLCQPFGEGELQYAAKKEDDGQPEWKDFKIRKGTTFSDGSHAMLATYAKRTEYSNANFSSIYYDTYLKVWIGFDPSGTTGYDTIYGIGLRNSMGKSPRSATFDLPNDRVLLLCNDDNPGQDFEMALFDKSGNLIKEESGVFGGENYSFGGLNLERIGANQFLIRAGNWQFKYKVGIITVKE